jgi:hypothetical protein
MKNWIAWNYKSRTDEMIELVIEEINDMLKKNNIKIDYNFTDNDEWDYHVELKKQKARNK